MNFGQYVSKVAATMHEQPNWRQGQTAFNVLCEVKPNLAELIRSSDKDPFYRDDKLDEFYQYVAERWDS
jgi:hypothetical protein